MTRTIQSIPLTILWSLDNIVTKMMYTISYSRAVPVFWGGTSTRALQAGVMMKKHSYLTVNIAIVGLFTFTTFKKVLSPVKT